MRTNISYRFYFWLSIVLLTAVGGMYTAYAFISNGQSAVDALGTYNDSLTDPQPVYFKNTAHNGANILGMQLGGGSGSSVLDTTNHRLFIADTMNNRVIVYALDNNNLLVDHIPDYVLGQSVFYTNTGGTTAAALRRPSGMAFIPTSNTLLVADSFNNRILGFDVGSITSGEAATTVIGQSSFTSSGAATTASGVRNVSGLHYNATLDQILVADSANNRVLIFTGSMLATGMSANSVLGQSTFTTSTAATTQSGLSGPVGITSSGSIIFVVDAGNNRVLTFTGSSLSLGMNANKVIGQTNFTTATSGTTQAKFSRPSGVTYAQPYLFVADSANNRVLIFTGSTVATGMNANNVLGQTSFTVATAANTQAGMNGPATLLYDTTNSFLFVAQNRNHRVAVFNLVAIAKGESATDLLGQYDDSLSNPQPIYTKTAANNGINTFGFSLAGAIGTGNVAIDEVNHRLFILDILNARILVFNLSSSNLLIDRIPDYVLGPTNFYNNGNGTTQSTFGSAHALVYDANHDRLFVSNDTSRRILVFDTSTITNGMNGVYVLGQTSFTASTSGLNAAKFNNPYGMAYDHGRDYLFVSDSTNNRVLVFSGASLSNGMSGAYVLGQTSFTTNTAANTQSGLRNPRCVAYDETYKRLFVCDTNSRILVFDTTTLSNGMNASNVLGQLTFTTSGSTVTSSGLSVLRGLTYDNDNQRLFASDNFSNRIVVYDVTSITNGEAATNVIGQTSFTTTTADTTRSALASPKGLAYDSTNDYLYVSDSTNNRFMVFDVSIASSSSSVASSSSSSNTSSETSVTVEQSGGGHRGRPGQGGGTPVPLHSNRTLASAHSFASQSSKNPLSTNSENITNIFFDVSITDWFAEPIKTLVRYGIVEGYKDVDGNLTNYFGPADPVTIAQILKISLLASKNTIPSSLPLPKNPTAIDWSAPYAAMAELQSLSIRNESMQRSATRGEVIQTVLEVFNVQPNTSLSNPFKDLDRTHPYANAILTAASLHIITGDLYENGVSKETVRPDDAINRAEVAKIIQEALQRL